MRQIKFRGKRIDTGEWVYGDLVRNVVGAFAIVPPFEMNTHNECSDYEVDENTISQFTGLHDKDEKDIYEGDIIDDGINSHSICYSEKETRFVACVLTHNEIVCGIDQTWIDAFGKTVIGNIHDNPDLMKGGFHD